MVVQVSSYVVPQYHSLELLRMSYTLVPGQRPVQPHEISNTTYIQTLIYGVD